MIKTWKDYQKQAITTAIYPKKAKFLYPVLGLVDESVEFYEKIGGEGQLLEAGDCYWYIANICNDLDFDINSIYENATELEAFEYVDIFDAGIDLIKCSAKICGITKKWLRDEGKETPSEDKMMEIEYELSEYMAACLFICDSLKVTWQEVAEINLDKLFSRQSRGKLQGSGDER
jgi:NTP pyrophosphatase (non-canonical NTP hydrolase)